MKSVYLPVSPLIGWSEMISEAPGDIISAIRSSVSCGISMRSSAALANGRAARAARAACSSRAARCALVSPRRGSGSAPVRLGYVIALQRMRCRPQWH